MVANHAYIVQALRTPVGKRNGALSGAHPVDASALLLRDLVHRVGLDPSAIEDVIWGCVSQIGAQASNLARNAVLAAGFPYAVPGTTLDRQCGSSQQAVHFAAQAVMAGVQDVVIAGGTEFMSLVPMGSPTTVGADAGFGHPRGGQLWEERFGDSSWTQFDGADNIARRWNYSREQLEDYSVNSHFRAVASQTAGDFEAEILPIAGISADEGPRANTSRESVAALATIRDGGVHTAASASQISDGAAALLIVSEGALVKHDLTPMARIEAMAVVGSDPEIMLTGPIPATAQAIDRWGRSLDEIGTFEVNEAFAAVPLAWQKEFGVDSERMNPQGGAIALGHPLGGSGARLMTTLVHRMARERIDFGLQTMCEGGGMANATILARV